jgi:hypothetical protein
MHELIWFGTFSRILRAAATYVAIVFGTGFVLGTIRVLFVIPRLGERNAELIEAPLMLVATILAARWIIGGFRFASAPLNALIIGFVALGLLLIAELGVVMLRGVPLSEYIAGRDPVSCSVYLAMLVVFALMPWLVARR